MNPLAACEYLADATGPKIKPTPRTGEMLATSLAEDLMHGIKPDR